MPELYTNSLFSDASLKAYYRMEGNSNDSKATFNGTDTSVTYATGNGKFNQGASFNGSTSKIDFGTSATLRPTGAFTWGVWAKTSVTASQYLFGNRYYTGQQAGCNIQTDSSGHALLFSARNTTPDTQGNNWQQVVGSKVITDGNFHLVVGTWDLSNLRIYVDGAIDATPVAWTNAPGYQASNSMRLGMWSAGGLGEQDKFTGSIDDAFFFGGKALSANEILSIYEELAGGYIFIQP